MLIIIIKLLIFVFFMVSAAFFSAAETAVTSLTSYNVQRLKEKYNKLYKYFFFWEQNSNDVITSIIVGINISVVAIGVSATSAALDLIELYGLDKGLYMALVPVITIFLTLIFANLIPKTYGRFEAEKVVIKTFPLVINFTHLSKFINEFLVSISNGILNFFGRKTQEPQRIQPDEIEFLLSNENVSPLSTTSRKIINRIIEFRKTKITQVMVPKSDILAVNIEQPREKVMQEIVATQFSRVPIYRGSIDNIIGIITAKDIAMAWRTNDVLAIEDLIRPVYYVPETAYIKQIILEFKKGTNNMAIVVDEFGSTIGLVTMEDLLEEIVGEVWDEYDEVEDEDVIKLSQGRYLINAGKSISDINDELKLNIPEDHFTTINGWILEHFGYIPKRYEKFIWNNIEIEIESVEAKKVKRIVLKIK